MERNHSAQPVNPACLAGERTNRDGKPISNALLLATPDEEFARIRPHLEFVHLQHHQILHEPGHRLEFAYFLDSGMISMVVTDRSGGTAEAGVLGNEGFCPLPMAAGLKRSPLRAVMQISGEGSRMKASSLETLLEKCPAFEKMLTRYAAIHGMQVAQTAGCNRLHDLEQRLARWLLLTQDRVGSGLLRITHDFLATMLGTDRPSVSLAAGALQRKRTIEYTHGAVRILNRKRLESFACECYAVIQQFSGELATS